MRAICFYLPQFHPIPENDKWWGKGFTEWTNVAKAKPRFTGHHQPQIPADLGFYDLRLEEARIAQAQLATEYGIAGFCYYHYWFNGKMLLERPFNEALHSGKPEFPFCLCWANENWTRQWDGQEKEILMEQNYDDYDPVEHITWLEKAFSDNRYIKINGRPVFLVYRADQIKNIGAIINIWRKKLQEKGHEGIYLCSVKNFQNTLTDEQAINLGFDALVEFQPNPGDLPPPELNPQYIAKRIINKTIHHFSLENRYRKLPVSNIYSYEKLVYNALQREQTDYKVFPCVMPSWDNSARKAIATIIQNGDTELYKTWLSKACDRVKNYEEDEQIVFINAWNEWAEGCHLEPDLRNGRKFLEATREIVKAIE